VLGCSSRKQSFPFLEKCLDERPRQRIDFLLKINKNEEIGAVQLYAIALRCFSSFRNLALPYMDHQETENSKL
jgi:hypothetical protein